MAATRSFMNSKPRCFFVPSSSDPWQKEYESTDSRRPVDRYLRKVGLNKESQAPDIHRKRIAFFILKRKLGDMADPAVTRVHKRRTFRRIVLIRNVKVDPVIFHWMLGATFKWTGAAKVAGLVEAPWMRDISEDRPRVHYDVV
jgi:hypothetical protein